MGRKKKPIEPGAKFGKWTVIDNSVAWGVEGDYVACRCECGAERSVRATNLRTGKSTSCGCYLKERVGEKHPRFKGSGNVSATIYAKVLKYGELTKNGVTFESGSTSVSGSIHVTTGGDIFLNGASVTMAPGATLTGVRSIKGPGSISCGTVPSVNYCHVVSNSPEPTTTTTTYTATYATPQNLNDQLRLQQFSCSLSGNEIEANTAAVTCLNGQQGFVSGNVLWVDKSIKKMQGDMSLSEFVELCGKIHEMGKKLLKEKPIPKKSENPIIQNAQKIAEKYNGK